MQIVHRRLTMALVISQPFLGRHSLVPRKLIVVIDHLQGLDHVSTLVWKAIVQFHKFASPMCLIPRGIRRIIQSFVLSGET